VEKWFTSEIFVRETELSIDPKKRSQIPRERVDPKSENMRGGDRCGSREGEGASEG
jgi:hypothetical protein